MIDNPNKHLLGQNNLRKHVNTPVLVVELDVLEKNIKNMQALADNYGVALRPHAKAHKSAEIARYQIDHGACGQCCATLGEVEVLINEGIDDILLTAPITEHKLTRLVKVARMSHNLAVVVDRLAMVNALAEVFVKTDTHLNVVVDVDVGLGRTGASGEQQVLDMINAIESSPSLTFKGIQAYAGMLQGIPNIEQRRQGSEQVYSILKNLITFLGEHGKQINYITGSGTGTCLLDLEAGIFTELQAGSYIFMDAQYDIVELDHTGQLRFPPALKLWSRVISSNHRGFATTDGGLKSIPNDGINAPQILAGAPPGTQYNYYGDEFGRLIFNSNEQSIDVGTLIESNVPHCDTSLATVNSLLGIRGDNLEKIIQVNARGAW